MGEYAVIPAQSSGAVPGRQHHEEAFLGKFLGDGTADAPAAADEEVAVIEHSSVRQFRIAAISLPLGGRPNYDGDLLTGCVYSGFLLHPGKCQW